VKTAWTLARPWTLTSATPPAVNASYPAAVLLALEVAISRHRSTALPCEIVRARTTLLNERSKPMANPSGAIRAASTTVRPTPQPRSRKTPFGGSHDPTNVASLV
jgi:hypothetical protein